MQWLQLLLARKRQEQNPNCLLFMPPSILRSERHEECHLSLLIFPLPLSPHQLFSFFHLSFLEETDATPADATSYLHQARWRRLLILLPKKILDCSDFSPSGFPSPPPRIAGPRSDSSTPGDLITHIRPRPHYLTSPRLSSCPVLSGPPFMYPRTFRLW